ncbi:MAG TPA: methyltransferase domain-containing protein [Bacteroidota bacterium]|nr:methyltransferase domain-containing protein [Bacteroidota bacterium]
MGITWRQKALLQRLIARLPDRMSYSAHLFMQRRMGALRRSNPIEGLRSGIRMMRYISRDGHSVNSKTFLEIGTGRRMNVPLSLWLCGASEISTADVNPYLNEQLVLADISYMRAHREDIRGLFADGGCASFSDDRFDRLLHSPKSLRAVLEAANIRYFPRADPGRLSLPSESADYFVSYSVLEYIPVPALRTALMEGRRILKRDGLFVHRIDLTDNFAHQDHSINYLNFLRFSEREWQRIAGNRFMYHSRLRIDDYLALMNELGLRIDINDAEVDETLVRIIRDGFPLDAQFNGKDARTNATVGTWIVATMA